MQLQSDTKDLKSAPQEIRDEDLMEDERKATEDIMRVFQESCFTQTTI